MSMKNKIESLQYPIGHYKPPKKLTDDLKQNWIAAIDALPRWIKESVTNINEDGHNTPYREGGWTVRQVVHHLADVHMNAFIRLKLALIEETPVIKPYKEDLWALLPDSTQSPVNASILLLQGLHCRWVETLRNMSDQDWKRTFFHPEQNRNIEVWELIALYAWHGSHHVAQIRHFYLYQYCKLKR